MPETIDFRQGKMTVAAAVVALTAATLLIPTLLKPPKVMAQANFQGSTFAVDVSTELAGYSQVNRDPLEGQDTFSVGDTFIEGGTIYPLNTLHRGTDSRRDIPGAIGRYTLRGVYTAPIDEFITASKHGFSRFPAISFSSEIFTFWGDGSTLMTDGLWPNAYFTTRRVVLGGTGRYGEVVGVVKEENIGENADGFCNLRVTFAIRKAVEGRPPFR